MSDDSVHIQMDIDCATNVQMKIIIGHKGRNLKKLINDFKLELIKLYQRKYIIKLKVVF